MDNTASTQGFEDTPRKSFFVLKVLAGTALAVAVVGVGVTLIAPKFMDQEGYKKQITQSIAESTGYKVNWKGDIGLSLLPLPHAQINDLTLKAGTQRVMTLKKVDVSVALMPLLSKRIEVTSVELEGLKVNLLVDGEGRKTWVTKKLEANGGKSADETTSSSKKEQKETGPEIILSKVRIVDGLIEYSDEKAGVSHEIKNINAVLRAESLKGPFALNGDLLWQGHKLDVSLAAGKMEGNEQNYPVQLKTSVPDLGIKADYSGVISTAAPMKAEGDITFAADDLAATLAVVNGQSVTLPEGIGGAVSLQSGLRYQGEQTELSGLKFGLGDLSFQGDLKSLAAGGFEMNLKEEKGASEKKSGSLKSILSGLVVKGRGKLSGSVINIDQSALRVMGQDVALSGYYDLEKKSFDVKAKVETDNADALLADYAPDVKLPKKIGAASVEGSVKGTSDKVSYDGTIEALQFSLGAAGSTALPMEKGKTNTLKFSVKHPKFVEAVRIFQPEFEAPLKSMNEGLDLKADLSFGDKKVELKNMAANLGGTSVSGDIAVATGSEKPSVTGALAFGDLVFPETSSGKAAGASSASSSPAPASNTSNKGRWSRDPINVEWMKSFDADLTIKARSITQNFWKIANANLAFDLKSGVLKVQDLSAGMFGGQVSMNGKIDSAASPLSVNWSVKANDVDARQLQSALTSKNADTLSGVISSFNVDVSASGSSVSDLVQSLGGKGDLGGKNIVVKGVDAAQLAMTAKGSFKPLERAGSLFGSFKDGQTEFTQMEAIFPIEKGIVNFTTLKLDGPKATINSTGQVNLPAWTIDLKNSMTVKDTDIPPFDFTIKGPLDNPAQAGGGVIENYLRGRLEKKVNKLIEKELGKLLGEKIVPAQQPAPVDPSLEAPVVPAPEGVVPPAPEEAPAPVPAKPTKQEKAEKAVKLLEGLLGH